MTNGVESSHSRRLRFDFLITSIAATVIIPAIAFWADRWSREKETVSFFYFSAPSESFRVFIYAFLGSMLIAILVFELVRATEILGSDFTSRSFSVSRVLEELRRSIDGLSEGIKEGSVRLGTVLYRMLKYDSERGIIFNKLDDTQTSSFRNVLFDSKTISSIFKQIKDYDQLNNNNRPVHDRDSLLFSLGKISGSNFGQKIFAHLRRADVKHGIFDRQDLHQWLGYWCKFDTDAGFGRFEIPTNRDEWRENPRVILRHSFLTENTGPDFPFRLCEFMMGYIEGILGDVPDGLFANYGLEKSRVHVAHAHNPTECSFLSLDFEAGCTFRLTMADIGSPRPRKNASI